MVIWALIALAVTYAVAAGLQGVLAVLARTWWLGGLSVALAAVAAAFANTAWRRRHETRRGWPGARLDTGREALVVPAMRHRDADPTRA